MPHQFTKRPVNIHGMDGIHLAPTNANSAEKLPLLVLFHGYGADMHDLAGLAPFFQIPLEIVCFQGSRATPFGGRAWFDLGYLPSGEMQFDEKQVLDAAKTAAKSVTASLSDQNFHAKQLIVGGFSQGAAIAMLVGLIMPEKTDSLLLLSGRRPDKMAQLIQNEAALAHLSVFVGHGLNDPVLPIMNGRNLREFWRQLPADLTYHEYAMGHEINQEELADINQWLRQVTQPGEVS
ncbi:MAG: hypothetical protein K9N11_07750 [Lentisphaeria bacterium]|nr:hypothetical protein [Candidatus Neomarinimicrobiota bacterium]MCF7842730.1 hypothetical protein [Lentisphaeria bacterium]